MEQAERPSAEINDTVAYLIEFGDRQLEKKQFKNAYDAYYTVLDQLGPCTPALVRDRLCVVGEEAAQAGVDFNGQTAHDAFLAAATLRAVRGLRTLAQLYESKSMPGFAHGCLSEALRIARRCAETEAGVEPHASTASADTHARAVVASIVHVPERELDRSCETPDDDVPSVS